MTAPPFVGLTGGIGAGKSEALAALGRLGAATISSDLVVHQLYEEPEVIGLVVERWGADVAPDGRVDRSAVARFAFASDEERGVARAAAVAARRAAGGAVARASNPPSSRPRSPWWSRPRCCSRPDSSATTTPRSPLLLMKRSARERAGARGHAALDERTARQLPQAEKAERATYVVDNSGSLRELEQELSGVLAKLKS